MKKTPQGMRRNIALIGRTNSGKSTLFNLLTGKNNAIVSDKPGTTTDPVVKNMELIPFGPITLIDTAGLFDGSELGEQRVKKTQEIYRRADLGIILNDITETQKDSIPSNLHNMFNSEIINVFTKCDLVSEEKLNELKKSYPDSIFISETNPEDIENLKKILIRKLTELDDKEKSKDLSIGTLLPQGSTVLMIVPIDSAAPKGRLILPQVQLIRECLDHGIKVHITRPSELESALEDLARTHIDLAVTDSQVFAYANEIIPSEIPLTSFSMILAYQKGNFEQFIKGTEHIRKLKDNDKILILEACTHNHTHEDIGRVKIPQMLNKHIGKTLQYEFYTGYNIPEDLKKYSMAILCGSCMINKKEVLSRLELLEENGVPVVNYGVVIAFMNGILERCTQILRT